MKQIKDYLQLYLGCDCSVQGEEEVKKITGISYDDTQRIWWAYFENQENGYAIIDDVAPILRPLSDMTEDEALKLCSIVSPTIFGDFRYKKWIVTKEREWDSTQKNYTVKREGDDHSFEVDCLDGDILLWEDNKMIDSPYMDFNYRFEYLKMGFDIFGLIESGLAIDATKLKTGSIA
jgi:hypothetical protein